MRQQEVDLVEKKVSNELMPEIKKLIPGILGFILKAVFPKMEKKISEFIVRVAELLIAGRL